MTTTETRTLKIEGETWILRASTLPESNITIEAKTMAVGNVLPVSKDEAAELSKALSQAVDWIERGFPTSQ